MTDPGSPSGAGVGDDRGRLHIADKAIDRMATYAAQRVPGVTRTSSGLDKLVGRSYPRADSTVAGDTVRLSLDIAVLWPYGAGEVARGVREEVIREVGGLTGMSVASVDVTIARFEQPQESTTSSRRVE